MKTLSLFTILLTVNFFMTSAGWGAEDLELKNKRQCELACKSKAENDCKTESNVTDRKKCESTGTSSCKEDCALRFAADTKCDSLEDKYNEAYKKAQEQCDRLDSKNETNFECLQKAKACDEGMSTDPEDGSNFLSSIYGTFATIKGLPNGSMQYSQPVNIPPGCALDDEEKEENKAEKVQDKIQKLKEEIADLMKDQKEADKELADKKEKVTEEIQKLQEEVDKNKNERQTEDQKKAADIQKQTLAAQKAQTKAILDIEAKNRDINQVKLAAQAKTLQYTDMNLLLACKSQIEKKKKELVAANKGKGSKGTGEIKNELQAFADTCIQSAKASRKQELQAFQDKIAQLNSDIAEKNNDIKSSKQTIQQEQSNLDALKKISDEAEQKELQMQQSKNTRLNQSLIDMEKYIREKQQTMMNKIQAKNQQIADLELAKLKKKPKYKKVISEVSVADKILSTYQSNSSCCPQGTTSPNPLCGEASTKNVNSKARKKGTSR